LSGSDNQQPLSKLSDITKISSNQGYIQESGCNIGGAVDYSHKPLIGLGIWVDLSTSSFRIVFGELCSIPDIEGNWEGEVSTVRTSLVPAPRAVSIQPNGLVRANSLNASTDGTQNDGKEERFRLTPLVEDFVADSIFLSVVEARDGFESGRIFGNKSTLDQERSHLNQAMLFGKRLDVARDLFGRQMAKRVLYPGRWSDTRPLIRSGSDYLHGRDIGAEIDIFRCCSAAFGMIDLVLSIFGDTEEELSAQRSSILPSILMRVTYCISSV
jgi:hypothetical protein